jgi:hypothetical protein
MKNVLAGLYSITVAALLYTSVAAIAQDTVVFILKGPPESLSAFAKAINAPQIAEQVRNCELLSKNKSLNLERGHEDPVPIDEIAYGCTDTTSQTFAAFGSAFLKARDSKYNVSLASADPPPASAVDIPSDPLILAAADDRSLTMLSVGCAAGCLKNSCGGGNSYCWRSNAMCRIQC